MTKHDEIHPGAKPIVYVREAPRESLPSELQEAPGPLYALHDAEGNRLALAHDRDVAFALARRNDLSPLSVH
ncbi:MAG: DUF1150 family protein [Pseudomonadota bacterium]